MKKIIYLMLSVLLISCSKVAITDRNQIILIPDAQMKAMSLQSYEQFMDEASVSKDASNTALLNQVGRNITAAVETYLQDNGRASQINNFSWSFTLVQSPEANAFCMPGGQIVFYEGILPYTQDAAGMAVVMGHEVAHAVAKHSSEQITQQLLLQYGLNFTNLLLSQQSEALVSVINSVYGIGSQIGVTLRYSRTHEYEADRLGLIFMAMAGYDPREAVDFWQRMSGNSSGSLEILSTHPSDANRIEKIKEHLPEALTYYKN